MSVGENTAWIGVDWGTNHLRVWAMDRANALLAERTADQGGGAADSAGFEQKLLGMIDDFLMADRVTPVLCSGPAGPLQEGGKDAYLTTPCQPPNTAQAIRLAGQDPRIELMILPGVKQDTPPDVMWGEETQVAGFLHETPTFDGVLVLAGRHTKWVHISAEEIVSFQTFMTGELHSLLARQSVLRPAVSGNGWDSAAFEKAVSAAISKPESVAAKLFGLHAATVLSAQSPETAGACLSGLLVGLELAATRPYWLGQNLAIISAPDIGEVYAKALAIQGLQAHVYDAQSMTRSGLIAAQNARRIPKD